MADFSVDARSLARELTEIVNRYADRGCTPEDSLAGLAYFFANFQLTLTEAATFRFLMLVREATERICEAETGGQQVRLFDTPIVGGNSH